MTWRGYKNNWGDSQSEERFVINRGEEGRDHGWWGENQPSGGCSAYCGCSYSPTIPSSENRTFMVSKLVYLKYKESININTRVIQGDLPPHPMLPHMPLTLSLSHSMCFKLLRTTHLCDFLTSANSFTSLLARQVWVEQLCLHIFECV